VAQLLTVKTLPFKSSSLETIPGFASPTSGVTEKVGPSPSPIPEFSVNKISIILFQYIHKSFYIRDKEIADSIEQNESLNCSAEPPLYSQSQNTISVTSPVTDSVPLK